MEIRWTIRSNRFFEFGSSRNPGKPDAALGLSASRIDSPTRSQMSPEKSSARVNPRDNVTWSEDTVVSLWTPETESSFVLHAPSADARYPSISPSLDALRGAATPFPRFLRRAVFSKSVDEDAFRLAFPCSWLMALRYESSGSVVIEECGQLRSEVSALHRKRCESKEASIWYGGIS